MSKDSSSRRRHSTVKPSPVAVIAGEIERVHFCAGGRDRGRAAWWCLRQHGRACRIEQLEAAAAVGAVADQRGALRAIGQIADLVDADARTGVGLVGDDRRCRRSATPCRDRRSSLRLAPPTWKTICASGRSTGALNLRLDDLSARGRRGASLRCRRSRDRPASGRGRGRGRLGSPAIGEAQLVGSRPSSAANHWCRRWRPTDW